MVRINQAAERFVATLNRIGEFGAGHAVTHNEITTKAMTEAVQQLGTTAGIASRFGVQVKPDRQSAESVEAGNRTNGFRFDFKSGTPKELADGIISMTDRLIPDRIEVFNAHIIASRVTEITRSMIESTGSIPALQDVLNELDERYTQGLGHDVILSEQEVRSLWTAATTAYESTINFYSTQNRVNEETSV